MENGHENGVTKNGIGTNGTEDHRGENSASQQPWTISTIPGVGRVLLASRDISTWERVLHDRAAVIAPDDSPVCVGCLNQVDGDTICPKCSWAICKNGCGEADCHAEECCILAAKKIVPKVQNWSEHHWMYSSLAILRVLLFTRKSEENADRLRLLMDHWDIRSKDAQVCEGLSRMTSYFQQGLGLDWVTPASVQNAFGILKTNAIGIRDKSGRGLFPTVAILSHSCYANLEPINEPSETVTFRAKRPIRKGEELSMRYTSNLTSKYMIQKRLSTEWLFDCTCTRCSDANEFGTNFSNPKCQCGKILTKVKDEFVSSSCSCKLDFSSQIKRETELLEKIQGLSEDEAWSLRNKLLAESEFHKYHHIIFAVHKRFLDTVEIKDLDSVNKVSDAGRGVLEVISKLDPGASKIFGKYLNLKLEADMRLIQAKQRQGELDKDSYRLAVKEIIQGRLQAAKLNSPFCK